MPNLRGASPVGRGERSIVRAGRERSAEASRVMSGNVGDDPRRGCRTGGKTTSNSRPRGNPLGVLQWIAGQRCVEVDSGGNLGDGRCGRRNKSDASTRCPRAVMGKYDGTPRNSLE